MGRKIVCGELSGGKNLGGISYTLFVHAPRDILNRFFISVRFLFGF